MAQVKVTAFDMRGGYDRELLFEGESVQITTGSLIRDNDDNTLAAWSVKGWRTASGKFWNDITIEAVD